MPNPENLVPFKKGKDERRHMTGPRKPKNFRELREAVQAFLAEPSTKNKTRLDKLLADMARNKGERKALLEFAFGKVPQTIDLNAGKNIKVTISDDDASA